MNTQTMPAQPLQEQAIDKVILDDVDGVKLSGDVLGPAPHLVAVAEIATVLLGDRRGDEPLGARLQPPTKSGMPTRTYPVHGLGDPQGRVEFVFLGLQVMHDPPRSEAADAVRACHGAGIQVKMITGDHAAGPHGRVYREVEHGCATGTADFANTMR